MFSPQNLAAEKTYNDLDVSLRKANEHRNEWFEGVQRCKLDETLYAIMERIVRAEVHRLVVVDDEEKVIGIISLSDILLYLVLRPCGEGVGVSESSLRASDPILLRKKSDETSAEEDRSPSGSGSRSLIEDIQEEDEKPTPTTTTDEEDKVNNNADDKNEEEGVTTSDDDNKENELNTENSKDITNTQLIEDCLPKDADSDPETTTPSAAASATSLSNSVPTAREMAIVSE